MKHLSDIDHEASPRQRMTSEEARRKHKRDEQEQRLQQLQELIHMGEVDEARRLAHKNARWGFDIVGGMVVSG